MYFDKQHQIWIAESHLDFIGWDITQINVLHPPGVMGVRTIPSQDIAEVHMIRSTGKVPVGRVVYSSVELVPFAEFRVRRIGDSDG